jgi:hypothetical protein
LLLYHGNCMLLFLVSNGLCFVFIFQVGSVIKNPEISALVPILLSALMDPNAHTKHSLDILLQVIRPKIAFSRTVGFRLLASLRQSRIQDWLLLFRFTSSCFFGRLLLLTP